MKNNSKLLNQETITLKIALLHNEAHALALKYSWPDKIPTFKLLYSKKASGAFINLETREITLTPKHLQIPLEFVRFTLAHEIAHYYQIISNYEPKFSEIMWLRLYSFIALCMGLCFVTYSALELFFTGTSIFDSVIVMSSLILYVFLTARIYRILVVKAREQLFESNADAQAIEILKDKSAIEYFKTNQQIELESYLLDKKKINKYLKYMNVTPIKSKNFKNLPMRLALGLINFSLGTIWALRNSYNALFSTHPTDTKRIDNISKLMIDA